MSTPTLVTERLRLEPVGLHHAPALQRHFADWEVIRHLAAVIPWPYPDDGMVFFLETDLLPRIAAGKTMAWAIVPKDHGEAVGLIEWRADPELEDDRGFWLARPFWGRGYVTEAVVAFQDFVFFECGVERLEVRTAVNNPGSRRVKEKTGAVVVDRVTCAHHDGDEAELWVVTKARWAELRGR